MGYTGARIFYTNSSTYSNSNLYIIHLHGNIIIFELFIIFVSFVVKNRRNLTTSMLERKDSSSPKFPENTSIILSIYVMPQYSNNNLF